MYYTDTQLCHRFVRFQLSDKQTEEGRQRLDELIRDLYREETGTLYHRI